MTKKRSPKRSRAPKQPDLPLRISRETLEKGVLIESDRIEAGKRIREINSNIRKPGRAEGLHIRLTVGEDSVGLAMPPGYFSDLVVNGIVKTLEAIQDECVQKLKAMGIEIQDQ